MQITDVRVRKITKEGKMRAIVSITIDDEFVIHDIKVIEGEKGLFIAMPSKKATDGEYREPKSSGRRISGHRPSDQLRHEGKYSEDHIGKLRESTAGAGRGMISHFRWKHVDKA